MFLKTYTTKNRENTRCKQSQNSGSWEANEQKTNSSTKKADSKMVKGGCGVGEGSEIQPLYRAESSNGSGSNSIRSSWN